MFAVAADIVFKHLLCPPINEHPHLYHLLLLAIFHHKNDGAYFILSSICRTYVLVYHLIPPSLRLPLLENNPAEFRVRAKDGHADNYGACPLHVGQLGLASRPHNFSFAVISSHNFHSSLFMFLFLPLNYLFWSIFDILSRVNEYLISKLTIMAYL